MILLAACTVALVLIAAVATYFVARAALALVEARKEVTVLRKHAKEVLRDVQRTQKQAQRILERQYEFARKADALLMDPKVQAALSKGQRES